MYYNDVPRGPSLANGGGGWRFPLAQPRASHRLVAARIPILTRAGCHRFVRPLGSREIARHDEPSSSLSLSSSFFLSPSFSLCLIFSTEVKWKYTPGQILVYAGCGFPLLFCYSIHIRTTRFHRNRVLLFRRYPVRGIFMQRKIMARIFRTGRIRRGIFTYSAIIDNKPTPRRNIYVKMIKNIAITANNTHFMDIAVISKTNEELKKNKDQLFLSL